jgi:hypothetical protein
MQVGFPIAIIQRQTGFALDAHTHFPLTLEQPIRTADLPECHWHLYLLAEPQHPFVSFSPPPMSFSLYSDAATFAVSWSLLVVHRTIAESSEMGWIRCRDNASITVVAVVCKEERGHTYCFFKVKETRIEGRPLMTNEKLEMTNENEDCTIIALQSAVRASVSAARSVGLE